MPEFITNILTGIRQWGANLAESEEVSAVTNVDVSINAVTPVVDKTSDSSTSFAIDPNKMYMFGTRTVLTITLNAGESDVVNEYMFQFTSGSTPTVLTMPNAVRWIKEPISISANKKYSVSVENNLGILSEWPTGSNS